MPRDAPPREELSFFHSSSPCATKDKEKDKASMS